MLASTAPHAELQLGSGVGRHRPGPVAGQAQARAQDAPVQTSPASSLWSQLLRPQGLRGQSRRACSLPPHPTSSIHTGPEPWPNRAPPGAASAPPQPSSRQATEASRRSHPSSHTVPQRPECHTSRRPAHPWGPAARRRLSGKTEMDSGFKCPSQWPTRPFGGDRGPEWVRVPGCWEQTPGFPDRVAVEVGGTWPDAESSGLRVNRRTPQGPGLVQTGLGLPSPHPDLQRGLTLAGGSGCQRGGPGGLGLLGRPGALLPGAALGGPSWVGGWERRQQEGGWEPLIPAAAWGAVMGTFGVGEEIGICLSPGPSDRKASFPQG